MSISDQSMNRAIQLDKVLIELVEAFGYIRKTKGTSYRDPELEGRICRRLAIGCIKHVHREMHDVRSGSYMGQHNVDQCRVELAKRCSELRYTQLREMLHQPKGINEKLTGPHSQHLDLDY